MAHGRKTITCRFCGSQIALWTSTKKGKPRSGWYKLDEHVRNYHKDEAREMGLLDDDEDDFIEQDEDSPEEQEGWEMMQSLSED